MVYTYAPPRFPHPPTMPLAVPAISRENMRDGQYCDMTNDDPAIPMKKRMTLRLAAEFTKPIIPVGMDAKTKTTAMGMRAPLASQIGPITTRATMAVTSLVMDEFHTCCLVSFSVSAISRSMGAGDTQMVKAKKKEIQAQCNARMCGR